jgi:hypothetical protein
LSSFVDRVDDVVEAVELCTNSPNVIKTGSEHKNHAMALRCLINGTSTIQNNYE